MGIVAVEKLPRTLLVIGTGLARMLSAATPSFALTQGGGLTAAAVTTTATTVKTTATAVKATAAMKTAALVAAMSKPAAVIELHMMAVAVMFFPRMVDDEAGIITPDIIAPTI